MFRPLKKQNLTGNKVVRLRRTLVLIAVLAIVGLGLSACDGGSSSSSVADVGSATITTTTTTTTQAQSSATGGSSGTTAKYRAALGYVNCMRSHGVATFPDPSADGALSVDFATGGKDGSPMSSGIDRNSPQYVSAEGTCRHLLPGGVPTPTQTQEELANGLKFAQCMRGHGEPDFPDPTSAGVVRLGTGIDPSSPQFQSAQRICQALVPGSGTK